MLFKTVLSPPSLNDDLSKGSPTTGACDKKAILLSRLAPTLARADDGLRVAPATLARWKAAEVDKYIRHALKRCQRVDPLVADAALRTSHGRAAFEDQW